LSKWINFNDHLLKKINVDYFTMDEFETFIICFFHQGMKYMQTEEIWNDRKECRERFCEIQDLLGIKS